MRNLAIDMGNTRIKAGVFSDHRLLKVQDVPKLADLAVIAAKEDVDQVIVCSVVSGLDYFESETGLEQVIKLTPSLGLPIRNQYQTPFTLGMDRLAAAAGAHSLYPATDCLVIDVGTTNTYDFLSREGDFLGGAISPGMNLRFKVLNQNTHQLPHLMASENSVPLTGSNTEGSVQSGVINGISAEIEGIIRRYTEKFPNLKVVMCGGDAPFFESKVKAPIFVTPHLVLIGLNSILMYHAQTK
jgi:type III pantothenate kinase